MVGVFAFPSLLPGFMAQWSLSNTEAGWISGVVFAGYAVAVPLLTALTDRLDAKRVYLAGALIAALSTAGGAMEVTGGELVGSGAASPMATSKPARPLGTMAA